MFLPSVESFAAALIRAGLTLHRLLVVNDSTSAAIVEEYDRKLGELPAGLLRRIQHVHRWSSTENPAGDEAVHLEVNELGRKEWCPARGRNCGLSILHKVAREGDIVLFFDDDILFEGALYLGRRYPSSGSIILQKAETILERDDNAIVGCRYTGRADASLSHHISAYLESLSGRAANGNQVVPSAWGFRQLLRYPELPIVMTEDKLHQDKYAGPGGLSAGFLAMRVKMIPHLTIPSVYNEDWFWLACLARRGATLIQLPDALLHAPKECYKYTTERALFQEVGEVLWNAVNKWLSKRRSYSRPFLRARSTGDLGSAKEERIRMLNTTVGQADALIGSLKDRLRENSLTTVILDRLATLRSDLNDLRQALERVEDGALTQTATRLMELIDSAPDGPLLKSRRSDCGELSRSRRNSSCEEKKARFCD